MDVFINSEKLDIRLESERNLKEVIEGVNSWLFQNSKVIDKIVIDGKIFSQETEALGDYAVENVRTLELTVVDINELVRGSLVETRNYLEAILKYAGSREEFQETDVERISLGMNWTLNILMRTNKIYNYEKQFQGGDFNFRKEFDSFDATRQEMETLLAGKKFSGINSLVHGRLTGHLKAWLGYIDRLLSESSLKITEMDALREKVAGQIYKIVQKIPDMQKLIEMIVADLQMGREKEAMANIQIIAGTLQSIVALLQLVRSTFSLDFNTLRYEDVVIEDFNKRIGEILQEMLSALQIRDIVLLTDLLTYELNPKMETYCEILKLIARELHIEIN